MLGNSNYIDLTGQMEEVFDSKISQINLVTEESLKDQIEEAVAEVVIKPEVFDDVYAKIDHTHNKLVSSATRQLYIDGNALRWWKTDLNADDKMYLQIGKGHDTSGDCFWMQYTNPGQMQFRFYPGNIMMDMNSSTKTTTIYNQLVL